jgi:hypothetical protein
VTIAGAVGLSATCGTDAMAVGALGGGDGLGASSGGEGTEGVGGAALGAGWGAWIVFGEIASTSSVGRGEGSVPSTAEGADGVPSCAVATLGPGDRLGVAGGSGDETAGTAPSFSFAKREVGPPESGADCPESGAIPPGTISAAGSAAATGCSAALGDPRDGPG